MATEKEKFDWRNHGDFKRYWDEKNKKNIWVLGYFGGGSVNIQRANEIAQSFAEETNLPFESVGVDEIYISRRFKHFKFLFSDVQKQKPCENSETSKDLWAWLND